jgi:hypothetical protein
MKISLTCLSSAYIFSSLCSNVQSQALSCPDARKEVPLDSTDFDEPAWKDIIEIAFPPWPMSDDDGGCPIYDAVGGTMLSGMFPMAIANKFNPCYYTKAFAGLDPMKGGYPTPIDTHYPYEFAAPFFGQPGDGSTHHCKIDSVSSTKIQSCPKVQEPCPDSSKDCVVITDDYGIGHIPPFVTLNAVKNGYNDCNEDICGTWFDAGSCNIKKSKLDELIIKSFGENGNEIRFGPPKLDEDGTPSPFYYKLEYLEQGNACDDGNCRGPHYCTKEVSDEDVWGDFCPYVHTGDNSGQYRHPHVALAAFELWIANSCPNKPECTKEWLDSPNGFNYGTDSLKATSITWAEMNDNSDPVAQPKVPYEFPNSGEGIYPGLNLYEGYMIKPVPGHYVTEFVASETPVNNNTNAASNLNMWTITSLISCIMFVSLL